MVGMNDSPQISPEHKHVTRQTLAQLPKVILHEHLGAAGTAADVEALVRTNVEELAADGVVYAELRFHPELAEMDFGEAVDAAVRACGAVSGIDARLIITAMRQLDNVDELARLTVEKREATDRIVGFDLAGDDTRLDAHVDALRHLRENYVPVTLHCSGDLAQITEAVNLGAQRIGHGLSIIDDFEVSLDGIRTGPVSTWVRDRGLALELSPALEEKMGLIEDYADHPLTLLQQMGFAVVVSPGQTEVTSTTDEFLRLVETFDYGLDELFDLTRAAIEHSFAPVERRQELLQQVLGHYESLADEQDLDAAAHEH
ncbi:adenosine deaminase [Corynebacterium guangdongense]|nr:adenosine deaminase [Corynebacterium guangdongense]